MGIGEWGTRGVERERLKRGGATGAAMVNQPCARKQPESERRRCGDVKDLDEVSR